MPQELIGAAFGLGFPFLMTTAGAATVFCLRREASAGVQRCLLGFAAGVMIAASVWSLLLPAIEAGEQMGLPGWLPAATGFVLGVLFLLGMDHLLPHIHQLAAVQEGPPNRLRRTTLLVLAVTLHNIPEGMAVGLSVALALRSGDAAALTAAGALALGIGIQNIPEGAAVSLPLRREGLSRWAAFRTGTLTGLVEPAAGLLAAALAALLTPAMPWLLAFAAGAMLYVVVEELIPEANFSPPHSDLGTLAAMAGFLVMMVLDVALG